MSIETFIQKVGIDRICHTLFCFILADKTGLWFFHKILEYHGAITIIGAAFIGAFISFLVGIGKEIYDAHRPNNYADKWDLIADIIGGILGGISVIISILI